MKEKTLIRLALAYLLIAIITFGHSWNTNYKYDSAAADISGIESFLCAMFWPLYWSAQAFKPLRPQPYRPTIENVK